MIILKGDLGDSISGVIPLEDWFGDYVKEEFKKKPRFRFANIERLGQFFKVYPESATVNADIIEENGWKFATVNYMSGLLIFTFLKVK